MLHFISNNNSHELYSTKQFFEALLQRWTLQLAQMQEVLALTSFSKHTSHLPFLCINGGRQTSTLLSLTEGEALYDILHFFGTPEDLQPLANVRVSGPIASLFETLGIKVVAPCFHCEQHKY